jgi:DNA polymerase III gamma/tau subunit
MLASGGMRDAQSILDQMIAFCGTTIHENDITDVYGLAPHQQLEKLAHCIENADEKALLSEIDQLVESGRDLYRILLDLEKCFRERIQILLKSGDSSSGPALPIQTYVRVIDTMKSGEDLVKRGLSDRVNFEITLLKAVREVKSVAIDDVIRSIADVASNLPETSKKKTEHSLSYEPDPVLGEGEDSVPESEMDMASELAIEEVQQEPVPSPDHQVEIDVDDSTLTEEVFTEQTEEMEKYIEQLAPSTREILDKEFHARFVRIIHPSSKNG